MRNILFMRIGAFLLFVMCYTGFSIVLSSKSYAQESPVADPFQWAAENFQEVRSDKENFIKVDLHKHALKPEVIRRNIEQVYGPPFKETDDDIVWFVTRGKSSKSEAKATTIHLSKTKSVIVLDMRTIHQRGKPFIIGATRPVKRATPAQSKPLLPSSSNIQKW